MRRRRTLAWAVILTAASGLGCSDNSSPDDPGAGGSAGSGTSGTSGSAGTSTAVGGKAGAAGGSGGASGSGSGSGGKAGASGAAGAAGGTGFTESGICGQRGLSTLGPTSFEGYEEFYIIGEGGLGQDICVVRYDVTRVGEAPPGCVDSEDAPCLWTHLVELSNPSVELDVGGVCENSTLGFDAEKIASLVGSQAAYGYVTEQMSHNTGEAMRHNPDSGVWGPFGGATYDEETGIFRFNRSDGFCEFTSAP